MEEELLAALDDEASFASEELAEEVRREYLMLLSDARQGADGLAPYVADVEQSRDDAGRYSSGFEFEVEHPFAELHEKGGPIEPTYGKAASLGWTRDEMYEALTDCNEWVERKMLLNQAINRVRRRK